MKENLLVEEPMINNTSIIETEAIGYCPYCGHHININQSVRNGYCPLCNKVLTRNEIEQTPSKV